MLLAQVMTQKLTFFCDSYLGIPLFAKCAILYVDCTTYLLTYLLAEMFAYCTYDPGFVTSTWQAMIIFRRP